MNTNVSAVVGNGFLTNGSGFYLENTRVTPRVGL